jgi:hypothetical protein
LIKIGPNEKLKRFFLILEAAVIKISPEAIHVVTEGSPAHISCSVVSGSPTTRVTWRRRERKMPGGEEEVLGNLLHFPEVTHHHPVTKEIKLELHCK